MIFEAAKLKKVFDWIDPLENSGAWLEIVVTPEKLSIGANYQNTYYIRYSCENDFEEEFFIIISPGSFQKLKQLVNLWPKCILQIVSESDFQTVEIIEHGNLTREKPIHVDCVFEKGDIDYTLDPPDIQPNCEVDSIGLRKMLEFCQQAEGVLLSIQDPKGLVINNFTKMIGTRIELNSLMIDPKTTMKLSAEANRLIVAFLKVLSMRNYPVFLLFLQQEYAFSIQVNLTDTEQIQIFTIHDR